MYARRAAAAGPMARCTRFSCSACQQALRGLADRNGLDTSLIDDVIMGCAQPVGEQGGNIARAAVLLAGYAQTVAGQQVHRFCASALEAVNAAAAQIMTGAALRCHRRGRGIHVAHRDGRRQRRLVRGSLGRIPQLFCAAGDRRRSDRDPGRFFTHRRRSICRARASSARRTPGNKDISRIPSFRSATFSARSLSIAMNSCDRTRRSRDLQN